MMPPYKLSGADAYFWRATEIPAIGELSNAHLYFAWFGHVDIGLTCNGTRISERTSLRRSDVDLDSNTIERACECARVRPRT
jgi:hypothetical protein